ncbi:MAG: hypothetical protein P4L83_15415 [Nevskia sp.]|nr:hypothetical protein [Nevskia sp.]
MLALRDARTLLAGTGANKIVSSLIFQQIPLAEKRAGLAAIFSALGAGGELHVADYGLQRTRLMRTLFGVVQRVDGYEDPQPNPAQCRRHSAGPDNGGRLRAGRGDRGDPDADGIHSLCRGLNPSAGSPAML